MPAPSPANDETDGRRVLVIVEAPPPPPSLVAVAFWMGLLVGLLLGAVSMWLYVR